MNKTLKYTVLASCMLTAYQAEAARGLAISATSHGSKDSFYADAQGNISGIVSTLKIENTGDETLSPGDPDYTLTLYKYVYSKPGVDLVTYDIPQQLAPGESAQLTVAWPGFNISQIIEEGDENKASWRDRYDIRENVSAHTASTTPWLEIFPYKASFTLVPENSGIAVTNPINFGFVESASSINLRIRNTGAADLNVTSISVPEGFSVTPAAPFTMAGLASENPLEYQPITITFNPAVSGAYAGEMTITAEGANPVTLPVSGAMIGEDDFFEGFELPSGASENTYVPDGWIFGDRWRCSYLNTAPDDKYVLDHSSADDSYYSFAITPRLDFGQGGALMFQTRKKSAYSRLEVMISTDRANWQPLALYTANGTEEGATAFPTLMNSLGDYTLTVPAGEWYVGFKGMYTSVNNVFGGKIAAVDHDVYAVSQEFPAKMTVNNAATFSATFRNLSSADEAAGSYTVELLSDGKPVANAQAPEWEAGSAATFSAVYTPHAEGEESISFRVTLGSTVVCSPATMIAVEPETSSNEIVVGEYKVTGNYTPAQLNYENATSQMILPQSYLEKYGITPGAEITAVTFTGEPSKNVDLHKKVKFWIENEPDQNTITTSQVRDLSGITPAYSNDSQTISLVSGDKNFSVTIPFDEPFVYAGGNIFMSWLSEEIENSQWGTVKWHSSSEISANSIYKYDDNDASFPNKSWSADSNFPVIRFSVFKAATTLSGTLTGGGAPVGGTDITARAGDVIYSATTDSEGHYSIEVFQPEHTYTVTVDNPAFPVYTTELSFETGSRTLDIDLPDFSQEREFSLTINVTDNAGCNYAGVPVKLVSDRFSLEYDASETTLDSNGSVTLDVYGGAHTATVSLPGMKTASVSFSVNKNSTIGITLEEDVNTPYALTATVEHDIYTGKNNVLLTWNGDEAVFADNFESYSPFTIDPAPWTGIDGDLLAPANLEGEYANKGKPNYGQIINPSAVDPAWDLTNFYTLAPRSGKQYAGFITPADAGKSLNDWLITPAVTLTDNNVLRFYAKGSDRVPALFSVGITEAENPTAADFTIISEGNAIECSFADWTPVLIPLDRYAGKQVKIGIRCTSASGSFISMIDDVFIGRLSPAAAKSKALRVMKSAANPNERFEIYVDGVKAGETDDYAYTIEDMADGVHQIAVKAMYVAEESDYAETSVTIDSSVYAPVDFTVTTNNNEMPAATAITLSGEETFDLTATGGSLSVASLPKGTYSLKASAPDYDEFTSTITVAENNSVAIALVETLVKPFNITADTEQDGNLFNVTLKWNQDLGFTDSFEAYDDFATGSFGTWTTLNLNTQPSYPIGLGSQTNIIRFPGCSTPEAPASVNPVVFNPFATTPSMESDYAIHAPDGVKSIAFFGPQQAIADKWLISPALTVGDGYELKFMAKAYAMYPEALQICVSTTGTDKDDFEILDQVAPAAANWTQYILPLDDYAGKEVHIGIRCVSQDGFLVQVDKFEVAPAEADRVVPAGKVLGYDVALNGSLHGSTSATTYTFSGLAPGKHRMAVTANYTSGSSAPGEYELELIGTSIDGTLSGADMAMGLEGAILVGTSAEKTVEIFTTSGVAVASASVNGSHTFAVEPGVYIVRAGSSTFKVAAR